MLSNRCGSLLSLLLSVYGGPWPLLYAPHGQFNIQLFNTRHDSQFKDSKS